MAKNNRTTSTPRRATAAKVTKAAAPVEWGYENGQQIVIRAAGHWQHDLPADRWRGLRDTIDDMGAVVRAFDGTRDIGDDGLEPPPAKSRGGWTERRGARLPLVKPASFSCPTSRMNCKRPTP
jgi:hypothetical protein